MILRLRMPLCIVYMPSDPWFKYVGDPFYLECVTETKLTEGTLATFAPCDCAK